MAKGAGSLVARQGGKGVGGLMKNAALPCLVVSIAMGAVSVMVGETFDDYVARGVRVGKEGGGEEGGEEEGGLGLEVGEMLTGERIGGTIGGGQGVELVSL